ncbi:uncharacterized protein [Littorina saxatilis]|uniref:uncharacterized protein n=1 Tax=Littorina saxatilis TaxID=31220 RepID=UPI0038B42889
MSLRRYVGHRPKDVTPPFPLNHFESRLLPVDAMTKPTRGPSVLDLVFTSNPSLLKTTSLIPGLADHDIVVSNFDVKPHIAPPTKRKFYKFKDARWDQLKSDLESAATTIVNKYNNGTNAEDLWTLFKSSLLASVDSYIPSTIAKNRSSLPWLSASLKRMLRRKQRLFKRAKHSKIWTEYRNFPKICKRAMRRAEWSYINDKIQAGLSSNNTKPFWNFIKSRRQDNTGVSPLKHKGKLVNDSVGKAKLLLNQYKSGTMLGPLLFLVHINDLTASVSSHVRLFADDCLLYREINSFTDHQSLQQDLRHLEEWAVTWGMRFNASKCYILSINKSSDFYYQLDNSILQNVRSTPYLGIRLSDDMKWIPHISSITKKANCTLGFLRRNLQRCPPRCRQQAYLSLVRPLLEYGAVVWDPYLKKDIDCIERVQRKALRFITGDFRSSTPGSVTRLLEKTGLQPLQQRRQQLRLTFFYRVVEGLVPALPSHQFLTEQKQGRKIRPDEMDIEAMA